MNFLIVVVYSIAAVAAAGEGMCKRIRRGVRGSTIFFRKDRSSSSSLSRSQPLYRVKPWDVPRQERPWDDLVPL